MLRKHYLGRATKAQAAAFLIDLGVVDGLTGAPLTRVAASPAPATGQYSCTAGVYAFATADAGKAVKISYTYSKTAAGSGVNFDINNQLLGQQPFFKVVYHHQCFSGTD